MLALPEIFAGFALFCGNELVSIRLHSCLEFVSLEPEVCSLNALRPLRPAMAGPALPDSVFALYLPPVKCSILVLPLS